MNLPQTVLNYAVAVKSWLCELATKKFTAETEFLPGALEVTESAPSPVGRGIIWTIVLFFVFLLLWASLSKIEVIAVASGKVVPKGQIKTIQSSELGIVREIFVHDGQRVNEGDTLISLDPTSSEADVTSLNTQLMHDRCELALLSALESLEVDKPHLVKLTLPKEASGTIKALYRERLKQEVHVLTDTLDSLESNYRRLLSQEQRVMQQIKKFKEVLAIDKEISGDLRALYKKSVSSRHQWLQSEQQRVRTEQDMASTLEQVEELSAARDGLRKEMARTISEFKSETLRKKSETENSITSIEQALTKANKRNELMLLKAPVSGYVQQLALHTVGGVVEGAKPLMVIVPENTELELETSLLNRDVGFVTPGQHVEVKLDAFPYTEYGSIAGTVEVVSADAVPNSDGELRFNCKVSLLKNSVMANGKEIMLSPGMQASAEIVLRERRVISYFLSPLMKYAKETLRER